MAPPDPSTYISPTWAPSLFTSKVLFCTGGAGTICSGQVRAFVHLGGNACIIGRNASKTAAAAAEIASLRPGARVLGIGNVDVRDAGAVQAAVDRCVAELGGIDFAIAGAAGNFLAPMEKITVGGFRSVMEIDAVGSWNTAKAVLPHLVASAARCGGNRGGLTGGTGGRMVFVSASFHFTGKPMQAHVAAAKAAVDQIAVSVGIEYGPYGVTSNVVTPGPIEGTEGMERLAARDEEAQRRAKSKVPLGRWGRVREVADATVFLFSDAGSFVNANVLVVDGGDWRTSGASTNPAWEYPGFLLSGKEVEGVKGGRKSKL